MKRHTTLFKIESIECDVFFFGENFAVSVGTDAFEPAGARFICAASLFIATKCWNASAGLGTADAVRKGSGWTKTGRLWVLRGRGGNMRPMGKRGSTSGCWKGSLIAWGFNTSVGSGAL